MFQVTRFKQNNEIITLQKIIKEHSFFNCLKWDGSNYKARKKKYQIFNQARVKIDKSYTSNHAKRLRRIVSSMEWIRRQQKAVSKGIAYDYKGHITLQFWMMQIVHTVLLPRLVCTPAIRQSSNPLQATTLVHWTCLGTWRGLSWHGPRRNIRGVQVHFHKPGRYCLWRSSSAQLSNTGEWMKDCRIAGWHLPAPKLQKIGDLLTPEISDNLQLIVQQFELLTIVTLINYLSIYEYTDSHNNVRVWRRIYQYRNY